MYIEQMYNSLHKYQKRPFPESTIVRMDTNPRRLEVQLRLKVTPPFWKMEIVLGKTIIRKTRLRNFNKMYRRCEKVLTLDLSRTHSLMWASLISFFLLSSSSLVKLGGRSLIRLSFSASFLLWTLSCSLRKNYAKYGPWSQIYISKSNAKMAIFQTGSLYFDLRLF